MDLENITLNGNEEELKEKIIQLPRGFRNMEKTPAGVAKHSTGEIEIDFNEDVNINLPTLAKDIKITSYNGITFTEFYYKKTNYIFRY